MSYLYHLNIVVSKIILNSLAKYIETRSVTGVGDGRLCFVKVTGLTDSLEPLSEDLYEVWQKSNETDFLFANVFILFFHTSMLSP